MGVVEYARLEQERTLDEAMDERLSVLIVDDDEDIVDSIAIYLSNEKLNIFKAYDGMQALEILAQNTIHLILMDVMMPRMDGIKATLKIRETKNIPIIMVSAKSEDTDKIMGINLGADDYITKPFRPLELVARVKAQLRRYKHYNSGSGMTDDIISCSGLSLNVKTHECTLNERPLTLTPTEFSILCILCSHKGNVVSAEELFHQVWGDEYFNKSNNTITVHIRHLREKMGDSFEEPKYIKTVWGCGYKIEA